MYLYYSSTFVILFEAINLPFYQKSWKINAHKLQFLSKCHGRQEIKEWPLISLMVYSGVNDYQKSGHEKKHVKLMSTIFKIMTVIKIRYRQDIFMAIILLILWPCSMVETMTCIPG